MYPALRLLSPTDQSTENGKRRNLIYTELPSQHGNGSELHPVIARERPTCLCDGKDDIGKVSKNARGSVPFHVKHSIKLPASLPALRLGRRHALPSVQENGTGNKATGSNDMGRPALDDRECPSRLDSDCEDDEDRRETDEKTRGKPAGTAQETPERRCGNAIGGRKRRRDDPPGGSKSRPRDETKRYRAWNAGGIDRSRRESKSRRGEEQAGTQQLSRKNRW